VILLDTHAWIFMVDDPKRLGRAARRAIGKADRLGVAAVSMWELALLVEKGRLSLDRELLEWIREALGQPRVELVPITPIVVATAHQLRGALASRVVNAPQIPILSITFGRANRPERFGLDLIACGRLATRSKRALQTAPHNQCRQKGAPDALGRKWKRSERSRGAAEVTSRPSWAYPFRSRGNADQGEHLMRNTPVHPKEPQVLELMGATQAGEMLPSLLSKQLAPCPGHHSGAAHQRGRQLPIGGPRLWRSGAAHRARAGPEGDADQSCRAADDAAAAPRPNPDSDLRRVQERGESRSSTHRPLVGALNAIARSIRGGHVP
jgi:PIN domain nuclease of toxin-antitoxin system